MKNDLYYIFFGQDEKIDECYLNFDINDMIYFIDTHVEGDNTKTKFDLEQIEQIRKNLPMLDIDNECLIPVGDIDDE